MINGLYRHGFMIAPAILDCVLEILELGTSPTAYELGLSIMGTQKHSGVDVCV
jgi:glycine oxidase